MIVFWIFLLIIAVINIIIFFKCYRRPKVEKLFERGRLIENLDVQYACKFSVNSIARTMLKCFREKGYACFYLCYDDIEKVVFYDMDIKEIKKQVYDFQKAILERYKAEQRKYDILKIWCMYSKRNSYVTDFFRVAIKLYHNKKINKNTKKELLKKFY